MRAPTEQEHRKRLWSKQAAKACNEVGILLVAFAPLDVGIDVRPLAKTWGELVGFFAAGIVLFVAGTYGEWRMKNAD